MFHSKPLRISSHVDQLLVHVEDPVVGAVTDGGRPPILPASSSAGHRHRVLRSSRSVPLVSGRSAKGRAWRRCGPEAAIGEVLPAQEADLFPCVCRIFSAASASCWGSVAMTSTSTSTGRAGARRHSASSSSRTPHQIGLHGDDAGHGSDPHSPRSPRARRMESGARHQRRNCRRDDLDGGLPQHPLVGRPHLDRTIRLRDRRSRHRSRPGTTPHCWPRRHDRSTG